MKLKFWQTSDPIYMDDVGDKSTGSLAARVAGGAVSVYLLGVIALGWWWDSEPDQFAVRENAARMAETNNQGVVTGYTTTATFIQLSDIMLNKRGGYLSNDLFPPGVRMDNIPEWEFGVLMVLRDTARVYRQDFSRSQSQSVEDEDLSQERGHISSITTPGFCPPAKTATKKARNSLPTT